MSRMLCLMLFATLARGESLKELGLPQAAESIAKEAIAIADQEGKLSIEVGEFTNSTTKDQTDGAIRQELIRALGERSVADGGLRISGSLRIAKDDDGQIVKIEARIARSNGEVLKKTNEEFRTVTTTVKKIAHQLALFPNTSVLPPMDSGNPKNPGGAKERFRELGKAVDAAVRDKTQTQPHAASAYAVEVRTKKTMDGTATPLAVTLKDGKATVPPIVPGEMYEVRILNYSPKEVAATLRIDGIDQFEFTKDKTDGKPNYSSWIIDAAKDGKPGEVVVKGWHQKFEHGEHHFLGFLVTEYGQGAVSKIKSAPRGNVGLIQVSFALSHPAGSTRSGGETGFGPPTKEKGDVVQRVLDPVTELATIRYQREVK